MTCDRRHQLQWSAFLDGELPPQDAREWQQHVEQCDACKRALQVDQALSLRLRNLPLPMIDDHAEPRWMEQAHRRVEERRVRQLTQRLTAAAAVLLVGCLLSLSMSQQPSSPSATLAEVDSLLLNPASMRGEEPAPQSTVVAQWLAMDLGQRATSGGVQ